MRRVSCASQRLIALPLYFLLPGTHKDDNNEGHCEYPISHIFYDYVLVLRLDWGFDYNCGGLLFYLIVLVVMVVLVVLPGGLDWL